MSCFSLYGMVISYHFFLQQALIEDKGQSFKVLIIWTELLQN